jgi:hypothetical protein
MPLERGIGEPVQPNGLVLFAMNDGSQLVPCAITAAALKRLAGQGIIDLCLAFAEYRSAIEEAASDKYDSGSIDPDGGVTLLPADFASKA